MIKKIVLAWDSNFTKVTYAEKLELEKSKEEYERGEVVEDSDEKWKHILKVCYVIYKES